MLTYLDGEKQVAWATLLPADDDMTQFLVTLSPNGFIHGCLLSEPPLKSFGRLSPFAGRLCCAARLDYSTSALVLTSDGNLLLVDFTSMIPTQSASSVHVRVIKTDITSFRGGEVPWGNMLVSDSTIVITGLKREALVLQFNDEAVTATATIPFEAFTTVSSLALSTGSFVVLGNDFTLSSRASTIFLYESTWKFVKSLPLPFSATGLADCPANSRQFLILGLNEVALISEDELEIVRLVSLNFQVNDDLLRRHSGEASKPLTQQSDLSSETLPIVARAVRGVGLDSRSTWKLQVPAVNEAHPDRFRVSCWASLLDSLVLADQLGNMISCSKTDLSLVPLPLPHDNPFPFPASLLLPLSSSELFVVGSSGPCLVISAERSSMFMQPVAMPHRSISVLPGMILALSGKFPASVLSAFFLDSVKAVADPEELQLDLPPCNFQVFDSTVRVDYLDGSKAVFDLNKSFAEIENTTAQAEEGRLWSCDADGWVTLSGIRKFHVPERAESIVTIGTIVFAGLSGGRVVVSRGEEISILELGCRAVRLQVFSEDSVLASCEQVGIIKEVAGNWKILRIPLGVRVLHAGVTREKKLVVVTDQLRLVTFNLEISSDHVSWYIQALPFTATVMVVRSPNLYLTAKLPGADCWSVCRISLAPELIGAYSLDDAFKAQEILPFPTNEVPLCMCVCQSWLLVGTSTARLLVFQLPTLMAVSKTTVISESGIDHVVGVGDDIVVIGSSDCVAVISLTVEGEGGVLLRTICSVNMTSPVNHLAAEMVSDKLRILVSTIDEGLALFECDVRTSDKPVKIAEAQVARDVTSLKLLRSGKAIYTDKHLKLHYHSGLEANSSGLLADLDTHALNDIATAYFEDEATGKIFIAGQCGSIIEFVPN